MDIGRDPGPGPGSGTLDDVKPGEGAVEAHPGLGLPLTMPDVLQGICSPAEAEDARRLEESLQRRIADQQLRDELARHDFSGRLYHRFQEELARYGTAVLRAWMHSGYLFKLTASRGYLLNPSDIELEELRRDHEARDELATMTVAVALPKFREQALIWGGWTYEGGASLPTYFMGACLYVFPNEFRRRRVWKEKCRRQDQRDPAVTMANALAGEGFPVDTDDLAAVSPYITRTIRRFGSWVVDLTPPDRARRPA